MDSTRSNPEARNAQHRRKTLIVALLLLLTAVAMFTWLLRPRPIVAVTVRERDGSDKGTLVLVDPVKGVELARAPLTGAPGGLAFTPKGDQVLVAGTSSSLISVHGVPELAVQGDFRVDWRPLSVWFPDGEEEAVVIDYGPRGQKLYARPKPQALPRPSPSVAGGGTSVPRGTMELANVKGVQNAGPQTNARRERQIFIDMALTEALVADAKTKNVIGTIPVGDRPIAMGWGPGDKKCYVVVNGENAVKVLDPDNMVVLKTIPVGSSPNFFERVYGTNLAVVLNQWGGTMTVLDLGTDEVRQTIELGGKPQWVDGWPAVRMANPGWVPRKVAMR